MHAGGLRTSSLASGTRWLHVAMAAVQAAVLANHWARAPGRSRVLLPAVCRPVMSPKRLLTGACHASSPPYTERQHAGQTLVACPGHALSGHSNPRCAHETQGGKGGTAHGAAPTSLSTGNRHGEQCHRRFQAREILAAFYLLGSNTDISRSLPQIPKCKNFGEGDI